MLNNSIDEIREERAKFAQKIEYLKETALDDVVDELTESAESEYERETMEELTEAADMLKSVSVDDELKEESVELDRILKSEDDITFEEMMYNPEKDN